MMKVVFLFLAFFALIPVARADWFHVYLHAQDGTAINVDYQVRYLDHNDVGGPSGFIAYPIWVNVMNPQFSGGEKVRVVFLNYLYSSEWTSQPQVSTIDLSYAANGRFTGMSGPISIAGTHSFPWGDQYFQELAVVINGRWLADPRSHSSNFRFDMDQARVRVN